MAARSAFVFLAVLGKSQGGGGVHPSPSSARVNKIQKTMSRDAFAYEAGLSQWLIKGSVVHYFVVHFPHLTPLISVPSYSSLTLFRVALLRSAL